MREEALRDVVETIELFCNPKCKHRNNGMLSPVDFKESRLELEKAGVWETNGTSVNTNSISRSSFVMSSSACRLLATPRAASVLAQSHRVKTKQNLSARGNMTGERA